MSRLVVVILLAALACLQVSAQTNWNYNRLSSAGPQNWATLFPSCSVQGQSPIDLREAQLDVSLTDIVFNYTPAASVTATNNGQYYELVFPTNANQTISGGPLVGAHRLRRIQFHVPAEHSFLGTRYTGEIQLYHQSINDPTKWAAVSLFFLEFTENEFVKQFSGRLVQLSSINPVNATINNLEMASLIPSNAAYYTYIGTVTSPPCNNNVTWLLFDQEYYVSSEQLQQLSTLGQMQYRPVSPLGGRNVRTNKRDAFLLTLPINVAANTPASTSPPTTQPAATATVPDMVFTFSLNGLLSNI